MSAAACEPDGRNKEVDYASGYMGKNI